MSLRKHLMESCSLHTVLDSSGRNFGKTNPLNDAVLTEFVELQNTFADTPFDRHPHWAASHFGTVRSKLCRNFTLHAQSSPPISYPSER